MVSVPHIDEAERARWARLFTAIGTDPATVLDDGSAHVEFMADGVVVRWSGFKIMTMPEFLAAIDIEERGVG